jgi:hypothetical protein
MDFVLRIGSVVTISETIAAFWSLASPTKMEHFALSLRVESTLVQEKSTPVEDQSTPVEKQYNTNFQPDLPSSSDVRLLEPLPIVVSPLFVVTL